MYKNDHKNHSLYLCIEPLGEKGNPPGKYNYDTPENGLVQIAQSIQLPLLTKFGAACNCPIFIYYTFAYRMEYSNFKIWHYTTAFPVES